jgi:hypothetical protein
MFKCWNCGTLKEASERVQFSRTGKVAFFIASSPITFGHWLDDDVCRDCLLQVYVFIGAIVAVGLAVLLLALFAQ